MILIIAGTRTVSDPAVLEAAIGMTGFQVAVTEVVSGSEPKGVDRLGELWAEARGIPVRRFPADWNTHGRRAGPLRNLEMARHVADAIGRGHAGALLALWDAESKGTASMLTEAKRLKVPTFIWYV